MSSVRRDKLVRRRASRAEPADSYETLPKKTSELPHVEKIIYIHCGKGEVRQKTNTTYRIQNT